MKQSKRAGTFLAAALAAVLLTGCAAGPAATETLVGIPAGAETAAETEAVSSAEAPEVCVYVCGSVRCPGVYTLPEGSRIADAVEAAGGFSSGANPESRNLAERVQDGEQIRIAPRTEAEPAAAPAEAGRGLVNLNTADKEELMTLTGIGEAKAEAILAWRAEQGPFQNIEDIMLVSGIKEAAFRKIRDQITV